MVKQSSLIMAKKVEKETPKKPPRCNATGESSILEPVFHATNSVEGKGDHMGHGVHVGTRFGGEVSRWEILLHQRSESPKRLQWPGPAAGRRRNCDDSDRQTAGTPIERPLLAPWPAPAPQLRPLQTAQVSPQRSELGEGSGSEPMQSVANESRTRHAEDAPAFRLSGQ